MAGNTINQKGLIWPSRRRFLKRLAPLLGGMACAPMLPSTALSWGALGGAGSLVTPSPVPAQPAIAATWGYNSLSFYDHFDSLSTIDLNNTGAAGYNWYTQIYDFQAHAPMVSPLSAFSLANSVLTYTPTNPNGVTQAGAGFSSARYITSPSNGFTGNVVNPNGAYFEARMAFSPSFAVSTANNLWPAWWILDQQIILNNANSLAVWADRYSELDFLEAIPTGTPGTVECDFTDWDETSNTTVVRNKNFNLLNTPSLIDGQMHRYGCLWVPQSKNSGTGLIERYIDGVAMSNSIVTYSASTIGSQAGDGATTGWMSGLDRSPNGFSLFFHSGQGWPISIDYAMVWS